MNPDCGRAFIPNKKAIRLDKAKALLCLKLLVEGNSVRSVERITEVHRDTVLHLLAVVGAHCARVMDEKIRNVQFEAIEADEIWGFVQKKEGHKKTEEKADPKLGGAYTFVAIEAKTKLIACYELGRRDIVTATKFIAKLERVSGGRFQLTTDGLAAYRDAVEKVFGANIDFAQLVKEYKSDRSGSAERRYSPGDFVATRKVPVMVIPTRRRSARAMHELCRAAEPNHSHVDASADAVDERVLQEVRELEPRARAPLRLL